MVTTNLDPTCSRCGAPILWAESTEQGFSRWIALTPQPHPTGRWQRIGLRSVVRLVGVRLENARQRGRVLHAPHAAECPGSPRRRPRTERRNQ